MRRHLPRRQGQRRSFEYGLQRLRSGLTRVAVPTGAPVVPVGLWGTATVWSRAGNHGRRAVLRRPPLTVIYGQSVIPLPGESPKDLPRTLPRRRSSAWSIERGPWLDRRRRKRSSDDRSHGEPMDPAVAVHRLRE